MRTERRLRGFSTPTPALAATSTSCCPPAPPDQNAGAQRLPGSSAAASPLALPGAPDPPTPRGVRRPPHRGASRAPGPPAPPRPKNFGEVGGDGRASQRCPRGRAAAAAVRGPPVRLPGKRAGLLLPAPTWAALRWPGGAEGRRPGARSPPEGRAGSAERGAYHGGGRGPRGARQLPARGARRGRGRHLKGPAPAAPPARGGRRLPGASGAAAPEEGEPSWGAESAEAPTVPSSSGRGTPSAASAGVNWEASAPVESLRAVVGKNSRLRGGRERGRLRCLLPEEGSEPAALRERSRLNGARAAKRLPNPGFVGFNGKHCREAAPGGTSRERGGKAGCGPSGG